MIEIIGKLITDTVVIHQHPLSEGMTIGWCHWKVTDKAAVEVFGYDDRFWTLFKCDPVIIKNCYIRQVK